MRTEWDDLGKNNTEDLALSVCLRTSSINISQEFDGKTNSQAPSRPAELEAAFPQHPQGSGLKSLAIFVVGEPITCKPRYTKLSRPWEGLVNMRLHVSSHRGGVEVDFNLSCSGPLRTASQSGRAPLRNRSLIRSLLCERDIVGASRITVKLG